MSDYTRLTADIAILRDAVEGIRDGEGRPHVCNVDAVSRVETTVLGLIAEVESWKRAAESQNRQWAKACEERQEARADVERLTARCAALDERFADVYLTGGDSVVCELRADVERLTRERDEARDVGRMTLAAACREIASVGKYLGLTEEPEFNGLPGSIACQLIHGIHAIEERAGRAEAERDAIVQRVIAAVGVLRPRDAGKIAETIDDAILGIEDMHHMEAESTQWTACLEGDVASARAALAERPDITRADAARYVACVRGDVAARAFPCNTVLATLEAHATGGAT